MIGFWSGEGRPETNLKMHWGEAGPKGDRKMGRESHQRKSKGKGESPAMKKKIGKGMEESFVDTNKKGGA